MFVLKFVKIKLALHACKESRISVSVDANVLRTDRSISSRRKGLDELSIVYEAVREDGIKVDNHRVETLESSRGKFFISGNTPSLRPYPISLSTEATTVKDFTRAREREEENGRGL